MESPHLHKVPPSEAAAEAAGQILGQTADQGFPVSCPFLSTLLGLDDAPPDFPIGGRHHGVDAAHSGSACGLQERDDARLDVLVFGKSEPFRAHRPRLPMICWVWYLKIMPSSSALMTLRSASGMWLTASN